MSEFGSFLHWYFRDCLSVCICCSSCLRLRIVSTVRIVRQNDKSEVNNCVNAAVKLKKGDTDIIKYKAMATPCLIGNSHICGIDNSSLTKDGTNGPKTETVEVVTDKE